METSSVLNLTELLTGLPNQLRYIKRFSNCRAVIKETVSEHSFYVTMIALFIAEHLQLQPEEERMLLRRCLLHDIDELFTGDVIHQVKHYSENIKRDINKMAVSNMETLFRYILPEYWANILHTWESAKDDTIVGRIVTFSDYASAVAYVYEEVVGGNIFMLRNVNALLKDIDKFTKSSDYTFIAPLTEQLEDIVTELRIKKEKMEWKPKSLS